MLYCKSSLAVFLLAWDDEKDLDSAPVIGAANSILYDIVQASGIGQCRCLPAAPRPPIVSPPRLDKPGTHAWEPLSR